MWYAIAKIVDLLLDTTEKYVSASKNQMDDAALLPLIQGIRGTLDDEDKPSEEEIRQGFEQAEALYDDPYAPTTQEFAEDTEEILRRILADRKKEVDLTPTTTLPKRKLDYDNGS